MLLFFQYDKVQKIYELKKDEHICFSLEDEYVIFHFNRKIEVSPNLETVKINDFHYLFNKRNSYESIDLYISLFDQNFKVFNRYKLNKPFLTIGNSVDDDIYIQDDNLSESHLKIDFNKKEIINLNYPRCYTNNILNNKTEGIISLLNMKLIINNDFVMINSCLNIFVNLASFNEISKPLSLENKTNKILKKYRNYIEFRFDEVNLKKPPIIHNSQKNPLIFSIGPSLTMTLASLTVGGISSYNAYIQGREIIEVIPMLILPLVMMISVVLWNPLQRHYDKKRDYKNLLNARNDYQLYLNVIKAHILNKYDEFRNFLNFNYFEPMEICDSRLLFQKTAKDEDYLRINLGIGTLNYLIKIKNNNDSDEYMDILDSFYKDIYQIDNVKIIYDLIEHQHLCIVDNNHLYMFYLLFQYLTYYAYDEIKLAIIADEDFINKNHFLLKINHFFDENSLTRLIAKNTNEITYLANLIDEKTVVFIFNEALYKYIEKRKALIIQKCHDISSIPHGCNSYILLDNFNGTLYTKGDVPINFKINGLNYLNKDELFKHISSYKLINSKKLLANEIITLKDVYKIDEATINKNYENQLDNSLRVQIGKTINDDPLYIDIHELGQGPHGLIAGMTGSGKSEFIIALICALCVNFSPKILNIIIIDFKGGGIIQNFKNKEAWLPHLIGAISNLDNVLLKKSIVSLKLEIIKRQKLFKAISKEFNIPNINIDIYQSLCKDNPDIENLAHLLIIVDEFAELKKQEPDYMSELISIARIGRSLGIHLILATQKPSGVVDDQIWSNCRFKICLKVQDKQDSYEMIKINDASNIKKLGMFYMLSDEVITVGQCIYANALVDNNINKVEIIDSLGMVNKQSKVKNESYRTELMDLLNSINKVNQFKPENLWLDNIENLNKKDFNKTVYGVGDDFYHKSYLELKVKNENLAIYSLNTAVKISFLKTYLFSLIQTVSQHEIYVIDGLRCDLSAFEKSINVIDIINMAEEEKINNLFKRCNDKLNGKINNKITLIITHYQMFKESYENLLSNFRRFLQDGVYNGLNVVLFTTTFNSLNFLEHTLITNKISLYNTNQNEISSIFDVNTKIICDKLDQGLIKTDHILEFKFFKIKNEEIREYLKKDEGLNKLYTLPYIKKDLKKSDYHGNGNPLGIDKESYEWITYDKTLILTGNYKDIVASFDYSLEYLSPYELNHQRKALNDKEILWIGPGYLQQYLIPIITKVDLEENEGIYFKNGRVRRVALAL